MVTFIYYQHFHAGTTPSNEDLLYSELYKENSINPSQPASDMMQQRPKERIVYEEIDSPEHGHTYVVVGPSQDPESTIINVANPAYQTTTLPGNREPMHDNSHGDLSRDRTNTLTEVSNPMYETTALQQNKEPEYEETQKEVKNVLYGDQSDACRNSNT